jgi:hypothetical protein
VTDIASSPAPAPAPASALTGRRVSLLPRSGGRAWTGTVHSWHSADDHVVARIDTSTDAVSTLDRHQVWLSTINRRGDGQGITIFAGRAVAVAPGALELDGVVRLADEPRRQAVRAPGCRVTLPPDPTGVQRTVTAVDVSRGGVRVPVDPAGWTYEDPLDLVLQLPGAQSVLVVGRLLRLDPSTGSAVLSLDDLADEVAAAIDRYALNQLPSPRIPPTR